MQYAGKKPAPQQDHKEKMVEHSPNFLSSLDGDALELACALVRYPSITPADGGCLKHLSALLNAQGFKSHHIVFHDTTNLYARFGSSGPHLCFAGHVDVVPPGPLHLWKHDPFLPVIEDNILYGRGIADMKGAIACFLAATYKFIQKPFSGSISILLTSDEEGPGTNGIQKMIPWMTEMQEVPDVILIGEPTGSHVGRVIQVGRRGSMTGHLGVSGKQGHIAYPHLADNPIPRLLRCLEKLGNYPWDEGTPHFQPSHLEITSIDTGNETTNIIPQEVRARFGIRFNPSHTALQLSEMIGHICQEHAGSLHELALTHHGDPFYNKSPQWLNCVHTALTKVGGHEPCHTTQGGTTDGRFLTHIAPVLEVGLPETTIHQINEHVFIDDLQILQKIYDAILTHYFFETL